uniref:Uncharacterized protein n=1 Tax=Pseudomonas monteilii TaxID=76759 RepID=A0A6B7Q2G6_9PSED|nr:hypothetical protein [Pseudomonas monteilii]
MLLMGGTPQKGNLVELAHGDGSRTRVTDVPASASVLVLPCNSSLSTMFNSSGEKP